METILEHMPCNFCGADEYIVIYPSQRKKRAKIAVNEFRSSGDEPLQDPLVKCSVCGLQYVTPRLKATIVLDGYKNSIDQTFVSQTPSRERTFKRCLKKHNDQK